MKAEKLIFDFTMGKTAPTFNHTFVMLANDKNIYHAGGSFRSDFDKTVDDFRDKKVFEFKEASIKEFSIEKDGLSRTFIAKEEKTEEGEAKITWGAEDGTLTDKESISTLLSSISFIECEQYLESPLKLELEKVPPLCKISLKNEGALELILFKAEKEDQFMGISSMNKDTFALAGYTGKEIVSTIEKLLGIQKTKEKKD